jgi:mannosyltransferase OCH1-like enzyme
MGGGGGKGRGAAVKGSSIPPVIWQTYRTKELPPEGEACRQSWRELNPGWEYRFMDDREVDQFVREEVDDEVYGIFRALPLGVMRADFWRYLVTRRHGGLYTDIDTVCTEPLDNWLPTDAELIVCPEDRVHLCQWTYLSAPGHPCLDAVVDLLVERARAGIDTSYEHFVHRHTGPGLWTDAFLKVLDCEERDMVALARRKDLKSAEEMKIRILEWKYFNGFKVKHLFGSRVWGGDYDTWVKERDGMVRGRE